MSFIIDMLLDVGFHVQHKEICLLKLYHVFMGNINFTPPC